MSITITGSCHCGLVEFEAEIADKKVEVLDCDCSICRKSGFQQLLVAEKSFKLTEGRNDTTNYRFGSGKALHVFCSTCGVKTHFRPVTHPNKISVNLRCVDDFEQLDISIIPVRTSP